MPKKRLPKRIETLPAHDEVQFVKSMNVVEKRAGQLIMMAINDEAKAKLQERDDTQRLLRLLDNLGDLR